MCFLLFKKVSHTVDEVKEGASRAWHSAEANAEEGKEEAWSLGEKMKRAADRTTHVMDDTSARLVETAAQKAKAAATATKEKMKETTAKMAHKLQEKTSEEASTEDIRESVCVCCC